MRKKILSFLAILGVAVAGAFVNVAPTFALTTSDCSGVVPNEAKVKCQELVAACNKEADAADKTQCTNDIKAKINSDCKSKSGTEKETCYKTQFGVTTGGAGGEGGEGGDGGSTPGAPQHEDCVKTSIIGGGEYCDENGSGIYRLLYIVINVLTMGVGVLGVLGIIISGIQYMTASGNEAQMVKAKKRIFEIALGLVVFGVMWVVLQWLIPGGVFGTILSGV